MIINRIVVVLMTLFVLIGTHVASSQASKKLEEKRKGMEQGQQQSWQQVDDINKETDRTKARYQQAQRPAAQSSQKIGYSPRKTGTGSAYRKPASTPPKPSPKKK